MSASSYDRERDYQDALHKLEGAKLRGVRLTIPELDARVNFEDCDFFSLSKLCDYFCVDKRIDRLLDKVYGTSHDLPSADTIIDGYLKVFYILLAIRKLDLIHLFIHAGLNDKFWPWYYEKKPDDFPRLNNEQEAQYVWQEFRQKQWQLYPHEFDSVHHQCGVDHRRILPIARQEPLGEGNNATTWRIEIHPGYHKLEKSNDPQADTYALKISNSDDPDAAAAYYNETIAFMRLKDGHTNVVKYLGSFHQRNVACILLEFADGGNLMDYFRKFDGPENDTDIVTFWRHFLNILIGLQRIHDHLLASHQLGSHGDLKPQNILVFSQQQVSPYQYCFKIADLGLSYYPVMQPTVSEKSHAFDVALGNRTYGSPESRRYKHFDSSMPLPHPKSDIWSIVCIISVAATWAVGSIKKVQAYENWRHQARHNSGVVDDDYDGFHDDRSVLPAIRQWHYDLQRRSIKDDKITEHIWNLVEPGFRDEERRMDAVQFRSHALDYFKQKLDISLINDNPLRAFSEPKPSVHTESRHRSSTYPSEPSFPPNSHVQTGSLSNNKPLTSPRNNISGFEQAPYVPNQASKLWSNGPISTQVTQENTAESAPTHGISRPDSATTPQAIFSGTNREQAEQIISAAQNPDSSQKILKTPNRSESHKCPKHGGRKLETMSVHELLQWARGASSAILPHRGLVEDLKKRDHVIVIDNAETMKPFWGELVNLVEGLAALLVHVDDDGLGLYWTNCGSENFKKSRSLVQKVRSLLSSCDSTTNPENTFNQIFRDYKKTMLEGTRGMFWRKKHKDGKPLSIYFLTDGEWRQRSDLKPHIERFVHFLDQNDKYGRAMGIQLIQFGKSPIGTERLQDLDDFKPDGRDIVDTVRSDGNVWKMLRGAIDESFDEEWLCTCGQDAG